MALAVTIATTGIAWAFLVSDYHLAVAGAATLPFLALGLNDGERSAATAAKTAVGFLTVAAVIAYPLYLCVLVPGFLGTRLFFRWRFGLTYPTLSGGGLQRG
jgi:hypothetical protein